MVFQSSVGIMLMNNIPYKWKIERKKPNFFMSHTNARYRSEENPPLVGEIRGIGRISRGPFNNFYSYNLISNLQNLFLGRQ